MSGVLLVTLHDFLVVSEWLVLAFFVAANTFYGLQLVMAVVDVRQHVLETRGETRERLVSSRAAPRVSVLAPAFNEEATIEESIRALMALHYAELQVVVVNDGSKDATLDVLRAAFRLVAVEPVWDGVLPTRPVRGLYRSSSHPGLVVVDKENGGKADALNAALNVAEGELVCAIDADTLVEPDALVRMVRPFLRDPAVMAAGGTIRLANAGVVRGGRVVEARVPRRPIEGFQVVEYLRAFLVGRMGLNRLGGNLVISGAFGLFRREVIVAAGGYLHTTVGEDMELVMRLRRRGYDEKKPGKVVFIPDPVAWTEAPSSAKVLGRQRDRWHRGLAQATWQHRGALFRPRYRAMGMAIFPYFALVELFAPVVEAFGLVALAVGLAIGALDVSFALAFLLFAYGYGVLLTMCAVAIDEMTFERYRRFSDKVWLVFWVLTENLGYRQVTVWWRLRGFVKALRGRREWGAMERKGFRRPGDVSGQP